VTKLSNPDLVEFWAAEFPSYSRSTLAAAQGRLSRLLYSPPVRNILSQRELKLDFMDIMDNRKILLCNLSKGKIGQDNSDLFGRLLVSKIQISAMTRADRPREQRQPFYLYVDEFQNFVTSSFEDILSEARKYQLCLILANQFTRQLSRRIHDSVFGNVGTLITFRLGLDDAQDLQRELGKFTYEDILNLEPYHTYVRIGKAQDTFSMVTMPPPEGGDPAIADRIRENSRRKYATPRAEVEASLRETAGNTKAKVKAQKGEAEDEDELQFFETE
jgi:hypothetical protein